MRHDWAILQKQFYAGGFLRDTGGKWAFVVENDSAVRCDVRLGRKNSDYFEVIEGLKPEERVITSTYHAFIEKESFAPSLQ